VRGHIEQRSKGRYSRRIPTGKDSTGKHRFHSETVRGTKKDAEKHLSEMFSKLDKGTFIKPTKTTLSEYLDQSLTDYVKPNLGLRPYEGYESIIRCHLTPDLGRVPQSQLKPQHLQRYYALKLAGVRQDHKDALTKNYCLASPHLSASRFENGSPVGTYQQ
jgi:integrase